MAEVILPHGVKSAHTVVKKGVHAEDGKAIRKHNNNDILDTELYGEEFPDGSTETVSTNLIADNLYAQVNVEGNLHAILKHIVRHSCDKEVVWMHNLGKHQMTKGWKLKVEWSESMTSLVPLKDLKESNPVEVAEYATLAGIANEPAFTWWVQHVFQKQVQILKKVKSSYWKCMHENGLELSHSVEEAYAIDKCTGTDFWWNAIEKEMNNVTIVFDFHDEIVVPVGYKHIDCHLIFDIKSDLTCKACFIAGGHQTDTPKESTYSSIVSCGSICTALMIGALNDLDVLSADIQNACINSSLTENAQRHFQRFLAWLP